MKEEKKNKNNSHFIHSNRANGMERNEPKKKKFVHDIFFLVPNTCCFVYIIA